VLALCAVADALAWGRDNLIAPALTGVFVGLALRWVAISGEVTEHDARAEELNTDLIRWVRDRERELVAQIAHALNLARHGVIEDVLPAPVPAGLEETTPTSIETTGAFVTSVEQLMHAALHEYRDQASGTVRSYRAMARSEGWTHHLLRRFRSQKQPSPLKLSAHSRALLDSWRVREAPFWDRPTMSVDEDPTRQPDAADIRPLEEDAGLAWDTAGRVQVGE
jgi:hypothetical protein